MEPPLPDSATFTSLLQSMGIGQEEDHSFFRENGERMHLQHVLNMLVNGHGVDCVNSRNRLR